MSYQSVNPFNGQILKTYDFHDQAKIDESLDHAEKLLKSDWSKKTWKNALRYLKKWQVS